MKFAKHAAVLHFGEGEIAAAAQLYDEAVQCESDDSYLQFALGDARRRLGQREEARAAFGRCLQLAREQGETDLVQLVLKAQPDLE